MRRHLLTRILALFLTIGLTLPVPAGASPEISRRTLRPMLDRSGLEEALKPAPAAGLGERDAQGENRRPEFPIKPEELLLYHKRAGESTEQKAANSIWDHLPADFKDSSLLTPLDLKAEGLVLLTRNPVLTESNRRHDVGSVPVTYEVEAPRPPDASELAQIRRGTWVRVRGRSGRGNGTEFFRPATAELMITDGGPVGRLRITFPNGSQFQAGAMLEKRGIEALTTTRVAFGPILLNGMLPGGYRRARWQELLALADLYGIESLSSDRRTPKQETAIREETVDQELILGLLEDEQYLRDIFESIFARPDLAAQRVEGQDIIHVWEGGFKRVYRVALSLRGEPSPYSFYVKIVKPDVKKSDSDYSYDMAYVNRMTQIADQARQKFLFLHPPSAQNQFPADRLGRSRIVFSEGAISPTNVRLEQFEARRLVIETYMKLYRVFGGTVFLEDPKPPNVVLRRLSRQRYEGTVVDLDNFLEWGQGLFDSSVVNNLLDYGFKTDEIVPVMEQVLGTRNTAELLGGAHHFQKTLGIRRSDFPERYPAHRQLLEQKMAEGNERPPLLLPASIRITLNNREQFVPEGATLADLLSDRYVHPQRMAVRVNDSPLLEEEDGSLSLAKRWALYDRTRLQEEWNITWAPAEKPLLESEEKPGEERIRVQSRRARIRALNETARFDRQLEEFRDALERFRQDLTGRYAAENEYLKAVRHALSRLIHGIDRYLKQPLTYPLNRQRLEGAARTFDRVDFKSEGDRTRLRDQLAKLRGAGFALDARFREAMNSDGGPAAGLEEVTSREAEEVLHQLHGATPDERLKAFARLNEWLEKTPLPPALVEKGDDAVLFTEDNVTFNNDPRVNEAAQQTLITLAKRGMGRWAFEYLLRSPLKPPDLDARVRKALAESPPPAGLEESQATVAAHPLPRQVGGLSPEVPVEVDIEPGEDLNGEILVEGRAVGGFEARLEGETLHLDSVFIGDSLSSLSSFQGQGIGTVAVRRILKEAMARGAEQFESRVKNPGLLRILHKEQLLDPAETTVTDPDAHPPEPIPLNAFYDKYDVENLPARYDSVDWIVEGRLAPAAGLEEGKLEELVRYLRQEHVASTVELLIEPGKVVQLGDYFPVVGGMVKAAGFERGEARLVLTGTSAVLQGKVRVFVAGAQAETLKRNLAQSPGVEIAETLDDTVTLVIADSSFDPAARREFLARRAGAFLQVDRPEVAQKITPALLAELAQEGLLRPGTFLLLNSLVAGDLGEAVLVFA